LGFRAGGILCLDLDSSRTGAFGNKVDVVQVHIFLIHFASDSTPQTARIRNWRTIHTARERKAWRIVLG